MASGNDSVAHADRTPLGRSAQYQPLILVWVAFATGILLDRWFLPDWILVLCFAFLGVLGCLVARFRKLNSLSSLFLLSLISSGGLLYHQIRFSSNALPQLQGFTVTDDQPVCLRGVIADQPRWLAPARMKFPTSVPRGYRSRLALQIQQVRHKTEWVEADGMAEVFVDGQLAGMYVGQRVEVFGKLAPFSKPSNPGQFDFQEYYRRRGIRYFLRVSHPDQVQLLSPDSSVNPVTKISKLRTSLDRALWTHIEPERAALASAMLLGNRQQLDDLARQQFLITGTVHLLAISGLHVGILQALYCVYRDLAHGSSIELDVDDRFCLWICLAR